MILCKHCGQGISKGDWPVHLTGGHKGKHRCDPGDSGLMYGYEAEPIGSPCKYPCVGFER